MSRQGWAHRAVLRLLALFVIIGSFVGIVSGYENGSTSGRQGGHDPLTEWAIKLLYWENPDNSLTLNLLSHKDEIIRSNVTEDSQSQGFLVPDAFGLNVLRHFWDPFSDERLFSVLDSAKDRAVEYYRKAIDSREGYCGNRLTAWRNVGVVSHLVQDMASPSHVHSRAHLTQHFLGVGYEPWVARYWFNPYPPNVPTVGFTIEQYLNDLLPTNLFRSGVAAGNIEGLMRNTATITYPFDYDRPGYALSDYDAYSTARALVPQAVVATAKLFKMFWRDAGNGNCSQVPPGGNSPGSDHPDDTFDVGGLVPDLEALASDRAWWKTFYGRVGGKKGLIGYAFDRRLVEAFNVMMAATSPEEFATREAEFTALLNQANQLDETFDDLLYHSPDIAVLDQGYRPDVQDLLLKHYQEPVRVVNLEFPPSLVQTQPVLVIPSGGLYGLENSTFLKATVDEYVRSGGTLVVLSQQHGYEFGILPTPDGKPITGYGWAEDQACLWNGTYIDTYHQILSSITTNTVSANVDGYFTGYPENSTILLRRTANGQPAMLMYEYGAGRVVVSALYSDWGYTHAQATQDEIKIIRDLLAWAKAPATLPDVHPGDMVSVPVTVRNNASVAAASVKFLVSDPDRKTTLAEPVVALSIDPDQTATNTVAVTVPVGAALGIYRIDYVLFDSAGAEIQPRSETDSGRFVVSQPAENPYAQSGLAVAVNTPSETIFPNQPVTVTVTVFNTTANEERLKLYWEWTHSTGQLLEQVTVPANGQVATTYTLPGPSYAGSHRFWVHVFSENGLRLTSTMFYRLNEDPIWPYAGSFGKGFQVQDPSVTATITAPQPVYQKGDAVPLTLALTNRTNVTTPTTVTVRVSDPANLEAFQATISVELQAGGNASQVISVPLSTTAQGGFYTILTEVADLSGRTIGGATTSFELPLSQLALTPTLVGSPDAPSAALVVTNRGRFAVSDGTMEVTVRDPDGMVVMSENRPFAVEVGAQQTVGARVALAPLKFGEYVVSYTLSDETRQGTPVTLTIPNIVSVAVTLDQPSYDAGQTATATVAVTNTGRFDLASLAATVAVVDAQFSQTFSVGLAPGATSTVTAVVPLPTDIRGGQHALAVSLSLPGAAVATTTAAVPVRLSAVGVVFDQTTVAAGEGIQTTLRNDGGAQTDVEHTLTLRDARSAVIAQLSGVETIAAGATFPVDLAVPAGAVDGVYDLSATFRDRDTGRSDLLHRAVTVQGVRTGLVVQTDRQSYLTTEAIGATSTLTNLGTALSGGNLHLQVVTAGGNQIQKTWTSQADFQTGVRQGVDTYESTDRMTLLTFSDSFDDGLINQDRWDPYQVGQGQPPVEETGVMKHKLLFNPSSTTNVSQTATDTRFLGDFDATIDYSIIERNNESHAHFVAIIGGKYLLCGIWQNNNFEAFWNFQDWTNAGDPRASGTFRLTRVGGNTSCSYWTGSSWNVVRTFPTGTAETILLFWGNSGADRQPMEVWYDNFTVQPNQALAGAVRLTYDAGRSDWWKTLGFSADVPTGTALSFRTRTAETQAGLTSAAWSAPLSISGSTITSPPGRWIEVEAILEATAAGTTPVLYDVTVTQGSPPGDVLWQADVPVDLAIGASTVMASAPGTLPTTGKLVLQGTLTSPTGQTLAESEYPFYIAAGTTGLTLTSDQSVYRPGDTVTLSGIVENGSSATLTGVEVTVMVGGSALSTTTLDVPANGSTPFTATTTAGTAGIVDVHATARRSGATLAEVGDRYLVESPNLTVGLSAPDVAGREPFDLVVEVSNPGSTMLVTPYVVETVSGQAIDQGNLSIPAGDTVRLHYRPSIMETTTYTARLTGEVPQTESKTVVFGEAAQIQWGDGGASLVVLEGSAILPVTVTNTGLIPLTLAVDYRVLAGGSPVTTRTAAYALAPGASVVDSLSLNLPAGTYDLAASAGTLTSAQTLLVVAPSNRVTITATPGTETTGRTPIGVTLTNTGANAVDGKVEVSVADATARTLVQTEQDAPELAPQQQAALTVSVDSSALTPGSYQATVRFVDQHGTVLATEMVTIAIRGAAFQIVQLPSSQSVSAGDEAEFTFGVKNMGDRDGEMHLSTKAMDSLLAQTAEWVPSGVEKAVTVRFRVPDDVEERDYFLSYRLTPVESNEALGAAGDVPFHVSGVRIAVEASLNQPVYRLGETAVLTLSVSPASAGAAGQSLFARVNYGGQEQEQSFTLSGTQTLTFSVPIAELSDQKLFYGIYFASGRSLHLNALYVYGANDEFSVTTDKQVYEPGETVMVTLTGTQSGTLTLSGPGDFFETFAFSGSATRSITLPTVMAAGTQTVDARLALTNAPALSASAKFDVTGVQVKIIEAVLDRPLYAPVDTLNARLTIESNEDLAGNVKTWVLDPAGVSTGPQIQPVFLSATQPLLVEHTSPLATTKAGIHRLVYGVYTGDLLLASGSEAFDVGSAVLLKLGTDRREYPETSLPVLVTVDLYGTSAGTLEYFVDGQSVRTDAVTLSGFTTHTAELSNLSPGVHTIKVVLTSGGLASEKEQTVQYASQLSDLTPLISGVSAVDGPTFDVGLTVTNTGPVASGTTTINLYDGDPSENGLIGTLAVGALAPGERQPVTFSWSVLGKIGNHTLVAVVDPANAVNEFIEENNTASFGVAVPGVAVSVVLAQDTYSSGQEIAIEASAANLSQEIGYTGVQVDTSITNSLGAEVFHETQVIDLPAAGVMPTSTTWNTAGAALGGYAVTQTLTYNQATLASNQAFFTLNNTVPSVDLTAPVGGETITGAFDVTWQAADPDNDPLLIDIALSADGGSTWVSVAEDETNDGSYSWDTSTVADGSTYQLRVIAKDGLATATDQSSAFSLVNTGTVSVTSVPSGAAVYLGGNYGYLGAYQGTTNLNLSSLRVGRYVLRLTYPGYRDLYQVINIVAGQQTTVAATLQLQANVTYTSGNLLSVQGSPIDVGDASVPFVVDWNLDGLKDLIVGNGGGQILYYQNTGTNDAPVFGSAPIPILTGGQYVAPFVVDWDNDGKQDLIVGNTAGEVVVVRNMGSTANPSFGPGTVVAGVPNAAMPVVVDFNEDHKKDLLVGAGDGTLNLFVNQGTDSQPAFNALPDSVVLTFGNALSPFVVTDWNADGKKDLVLGNGDGNLYLYLNDNTNETPVFGTGQALTGSVGVLNVGTNSTPFVVDFNEDGLTDLLTGNAQGEVTLFLGVQASAPATDYFLHGTGPDANPPTLFLDGTAPTATTAKYKDSTSVNFNGGNPWKTIGTWPVTPIPSAGTLTAVAPLTVWLGLKNSDDQGTYFDVRAELTRNGALVVAGETTCITGITRNPSNALEATIPFGSFAPQSLDGISDGLSLTISTRIGTNPDGTKCGGHNNAVGLRLYFDATSRASRFGATVGAP